jgi:hypothetical protein
MDRLDGAICSPVGAFSKPDCDSQQRFHLAKGEKPIQSQILV